MAVGRAPRTGAFYTPFALSTRVAERRALDAAARRATRARYECARAHSPCSIPPAAPARSSSTRSSGSPTSRVRLGDARDVGDRPPRRAHALDLRRRRESHRRLAVRAPTLALGRHRERECDPAAVVAAAESRPQHSRRRCAARRAHSVAITRVCAMPSALARLRERYARATGSRKETLARALDRAERVQAIAALDAELASIARASPRLLLARRGRDLFGERTMRVARRAPHGRRLERAAPPSCRALEAATRVGRRAPVLVSRALRRRRRARRLRPRRRQSAVGAPASRRRRAARSLSPRLRSRATAAWDAGRRRRRRGPRVRGAGRPRRAVRRALASRCSRRGGIARAAPSRQTLALARRRRRATLIARRYARSCAHRRLGGAARGVRRGGVSLAPARATRVDASTTHDVAPVASSRRRAPVATTRSTGDAARAPRARRDPRRAVAAASRRRARAPSTASPRPDVRSPTVRSAGRSSA